MRAFILAVLASSAAFADGGFDGTWRMNTASLKAQETITYAVSGGRFTCGSCVPRYTIAADGKPHPIAGSPYSDSGSARLASDGEIDVERFKAGKSVGTIKLSTSADGKTLTIDWTSVAPNGQAASGRSTAQRVGDAPAKGNKVAGTWKAQKLESASESVTTFTFKTTDAGLQMTDPTGDAYTAKLDGKKYPYKGDPGVTHVVLKKLGDDSFEETDLRKGKVVNVSRFTLGPDGKTLQVEFDDKLHHSKGTWTAERQ